MARLHGGFHGRGAGGLHADDLHVGVEQLCQGGHARRQPAAADGHQDDVHVGQGLEDLIGDGALAAGDIQVVEGRDIGHALLLGELHGVVGGVVEAGAVEDDAGAVLLGAVDLDEGVVVGMTTVAFTPASLAA